MKTPYYSGAYTVAQHTGVQDDDQLRERMLEHRLANRDDVRDIYIVTALPFTNRLRDSAVGKGVVKKASENSKTDLSWAMHWAIQAGDQFFELQRGYPDPLRTGLRMSRWDEQKQSQIHQRYRQGVTAMTDDEIKAVGENHFSRLDRIDINIYDIWCNNCQIAVDHMLRDIGGLAYYRSKLDSLHEMVRQFFYNSILSIMEMYGRYRGWNEEIITKYTEVLHKTLRVMTSRSAYPKRHWIRSDLDAADGALKKISTVKDHWVLTVLESSLSLRNRSDELYVRRGADGKPELNFDALKEATKGIFDDDGKNGRMAWLKALPWLSAGFLVGTPRWGAAVISIAISRASQMYEDRIAADRLGLRGGLEQSMVGLGVSPNPQNASGSSPRPKLQNQRTLTNGQRRIRTKNLPIESKLIPRYQRCLTAAGNAYFIDHMNKSRFWDAPDQQEMCLKITDPPLSKRWEEKHEDGRTLYVNRLTGETTDVRPGTAEIWAIKKRVKPDWIKSTMMALPCGWELCRTEEGEIYYLNHNDDPPTSTTHHPMRQEIEEERRKLLPEWNVEWDNDRGKKYRKIGTEDIRWKAVDGPQYISAGDKTKVTFRRPQEDFAEPLPPGWTVTIEEGGRKIFRNGKTGKERIERTTHPLSDKRRRLRPSWEMRYTPGSRRYWVHHGSDGRGTTWWTRNRLLKNTTLKNNARGWKLAENGRDWEWFEGGDVPHSEIPVLDLDDPAEIELREYPFVLPSRTTTDDGKFIEPLPSNWVMRTREDGGVYFWNFKEKTSSEHHPNEGERANLPALWSMRFTRHGRQYFIDHDDGSTWWTHPREEKYEQKMRARPGQGQDGWKLAEDGKTWERFQELPDATLTEDALSHTQTGDGESTQDEPTAETWRSLSIPREWLKSVNSSDVVANARNRIPQTPRLFRKSEKSSSTNSSLMESPQEVDLDEDPTGEKWLVDTPATIDGPDFSEEPEQETLSPKENARKTWTPIRDSIKRFRKPEISPNIAFSLAESPQEVAEEDESINEKRSTEGERSLQVDQADDTAPAAEETPSTESSNTASPPLKSVKKAWAKRTTSGILALKKNMKKKGSEVGLTALPDEKLSSDNDARPAVDGLGITNTGQFDSNVHSDVYSPTKEKDRSVEVLEKR